MKKIILMFLMVISILTLTIDTYAYDIPTGEWTYQDIIDINNPYTFNEIITYSIPSKDVAVLVDINGFMELTETLIQYPINGEYTLFSRLSLSGQPMTDDNYYKVSLKSTIDNINHLVQYWCYVEVSFQPYGIPFEDGPMVVSFRPFEVVITRSIEDRSLQSLERFVHTNNYFALQDLYSLMSDTNMYFKSSYTRVTDTLNLGGTSSFLQYYKLENKKILSNPQLSIDNAYSQGLNDGLEKGVENSGVTTLFVSMFSGIGALLGVELLPNITIGAIVSVPLIFGVVFFILGRRKDE